MKTEIDPFNLQRFIIAQDAYDTYDEALHEIKTGLKVSHWVWFIFPQLQGLGSSAMCQQYGISGLDEAKAYLAHPKLHERLIEISVAAANALPRFDISLEQLLGGIDAMKFVSSMTLFFAAAENSSDQRIFFETLWRTRDSRKYLMCRETLSLLGLKMPTCFQIGIAGSPFTYTQVHNELFA